MPRPLRSVVPRRSTALADDELLFDYLRHLDACSEGWSATHVALSRLSPLHRREHHLRLAADGFARLAADDQGQLFRLGNGDLLFFFTQAAQEWVKSELHRLTMLFADDPLLRTSPAGDRFARILAAADLGSVVDVIRSASRTRGGGRNRNPVEARAAADEGRPARRQGPVPLALLAKLDRALMQIDFSSFVRRRPVCRLAGDAPPLPVLTRLSVSLTDLSIALLPAGDIAASRAVARYVGESIDRRLLALQGRPDDAFSATGPVALPLALSTLMSDAFRRFDAHVFRARRNAIVLEIDITDIFDNIEDARFACRLARQRGYRICLTGANVRLAPSIDWRRLCFDYAAIALASTTAAVPEDEARLAAAVERIGAARLILTGADSRTAIGFGTAAGVELFQGRHVDHALREDAGRRELRLGLPGG